MRKFIGALVGAFFMLTTPASSLVIITDDGGGVIREFETFYQSVRASKDKVVIAGMCASACTLVLTMVHSQNVCTTKDGWLGFHSAFYMNRMTGETFHAEATTRALFDSYPLKIRRLLIERGWDGGERKDMLWLRASEYYQPCVKDELGAPRVPAFTS